MQDEQSLVQKAQQRDPEAFAKLYEEHFNRIYRYVILRIGNKTEAEDLTQQVFLNAYESIASFKWRGIPFSSWLFRIAHNQVVDYQRKASKGPSSLLEETIAAADVDPEQLAEQGFDREQLLAATERLTQAQREVIALRFAGGLSTAEAAKVMGKSVGAVKAMQHSALVALRKILPQEYRKQGYG